MTILEASEPECVAPIGALLGEGPLWDPRTQRLLWVDIKGERLFEFDPVQGDTISMSVGGGVSALALYKGGGYVCAYRHGFARFEIVDGKCALAPLTDPEADLPGNRFNDGAADPSGGFWAGTMDDREKVIAGAWWRLAPDGTVKKLDDGYRVTNGPAFDRAHKRVYLTDSAEQTIYLAETDGEDIREKRVFLKFEKNDGYPDGMEVDADGCLWVAFWDGACVCRFSPSGDLLLKIRLPVLRPTSVTLVGDTLYVTSASIGLGESYKAISPQSGGLFRARMSRSVGIATPLFYTPLYMSA